MEARLSQVLPKFRKQSQFATISQRFLREARALESGYKKKGEESQCLTEELVENETHPVGPRRHARRYKWPHGEVMTAAVVSAHQTGVFRNLEKKWGKLANAWPNVNPSPYPTFKSKINLKGEDLDLGSHEDYYKKASGALVSNVASDTADPDL